ncbi:MAG TPA: hypothetical protein VGF94_09230 [Kofleriaceae bacterium]|jgi:hypothetical protein
MNRLAFVAVLAACSFQHGAAVTTDGGTASVPHKAMDVVAGAARIHAGSIQIDVEVGQAVMVRRATAGTVTISGAQVVKP